MDVPAAPLIGYCLNISRLTLDQGKISLARVDLRKGLLTFLEPTPATPPGFLVCTPDAHDCHNYVFNNLPILSFVEIAKNFVGK
jgi:hypothetical protein